MASKLFHISFRDDLAGIWKPRTPAGYDGSGGDYKEPETPRISVGPDLIGCFTAIYPNISKYFEEMNYPHMTFQVYSPVNPKGIVSNEQLVKERMVWDAHVTKEVWITKPCKMILTGELIVHNTNHIETLEVHPFNDPSEPKQSVGPDPKRIRYVYNPKSGSSRW